MLGDDSRAEQHPVVAETDPQCVDGWALLGIAARMQHRPTEALDQFARAQALAPGMMETKLLDQCAIALSDLGRTRECIELLERNLPSHPSWNAHLGYAAALLAENRQLDGWAQFEYRWLVGPLAENRPEYGKPAWMGQDLRGKTIYVRAEQGFGDVFQMLRYLPLCGTAAPGSCCSRSRNLLRCTASFRGSTQSSTSALRCLHSIIGPA